MNKYPENQQIRHILFFKVYENTDEARIREGIELLRELGTGQKGIIEWTVTETLDTRKGRIIVENGLFTDFAALEAFRISSQHQRVAEFMGSISDWLVGDYYETQS